MGDDKVPPRFRKTKTDKWAVMAPATDLRVALEADGKIEVQKKSGDWSSFTVASLGKPFDVDGVEMCYGYAPGDDAPPESADPNQAGSTNQASKRHAPPEPRFDGLASAPPVDPSEPLPEFQGGDEEQWAEF